MEARAQISIPPAKNENIMCKFDDRSVAADDLIDGLYVNVYFQIPFPDVSDHYPVQMIIDGRLEGTDFE